MASLGRALILAGLVLVVAGLVLVLAPRIPWLGKLPGDIIIRRGNFTFYFPWVTGLVLSLVLTLIFALFRK